MEIAESQVIELAKAVCRLRRRGEFDAFGAVEDLQKKGIENVSVNFVKAIYKELAKGLIERIKVKKIKTQISELVKAVFRLPTTFRTDKWDVARELEEQGFKDVSLKFVQAVCDQLKIQIEMTMRKAADKSHYYTIDFGYDSDLSHSVFVWSQRYFLFFNNDQPNEDFHELELVDSFNDKSKKFSIQKCAPNVLLINHLSRNFGVMVEREDDAGEDTAFFLSLIWLDLYDATCLKLQTIEYRCRYLSIIMNKLDPTEFVVKLRIGNDFFARICKLLGKKMVVGEAILVPLSFDSYFEGNFYELESLLKREISIYNFERQTTKRFKLESPKDYYIELFGSLDVWYGDKVFVLLRKSDSICRTVACLDVGSRQWTVFESWMPKNLAFYWKLSIFDDNNLIVHTFGLSLDCQGFINKHSFFKISIRKPNLLQHIAWLTLVKAFQKRNTIKGAYESARFFLPYNSLIRCPFVEPEKDEKKEWPIYIGKI